MRDYEELVETLRLEADGFLMDDVPDMLMVDTLNDAADAIEELCKQLASCSKPVASCSKWISVEERLPEEDGWYHIYAPDYSGGSSSGLKNIRGNMYSAFKNGKWSIEVGYHKRPGCVKAWMPLPEPPKKET